MADTTLKTDYKDDVLDTSKNTQRKYQMIQNDDGTVSFVDVTEYSQVGDSFGAADINATNEAVSDLNTNLLKVSVGVSDTMPFLQIFKYGETIKTSQGTQLNKTGIYGLLELTSYLTNDSTELYLGFVGNGYTPEGSVPIPIKGMLFTQDQSVTQDCVLYLKSNGGMYLSVPNTLKSTVFNAIIVNDVIFGYYNR